MTTDDLNDVERKLAELSAKRYRRLFYRWGHLLGWLALPLLALMFVPTMQPYSHWLAWAGVLLVFTWYFVVSTRVMGKLQSQSKKEPD